MAEVVKKLEGLGVGSILDYAAEKDTIESDKKTTSEALQKEQRADHVVSARTFAYVGEEQCESNKEIFFKCIDHVAAASPDAFAAIKVTALGRPELLMRISDVLRHLRSMFRDAVAGKAVKPTEQQGGPLNEFMMAGQISRAQLVAWLTQSGLGNAEGFVNEIWVHMDTTKDDLVDFSEWMTFMQPTNKHARQLFIGGGSFESIPALSAEEAGEFDSMLARLDAVGAHAAKRRVRLMVDAEQTYFQPAIDLLVTGLQRRYNKDFPSVYGTYQCYARDAEARLQSDLRTARREGWQFAAKIVRGAYMVQERELAKKKGYPSPIWANIEETHACYHRVVDTLLQNPSMSDVAVLFATHNDKTVSYIVDQILSRNVNRDRVAFGQLLGMCDHVSLSLGTAGYKVYKYVPYGPIREVVPYLTRRAVENSSLLGSPGVKVERQMIWNEVKRRFNQHQ